MSFNFYVLKLKGACFILKDYLCIMSISHEELSEKIKQAEARIKQEKLSEEDRKNSSMIAKALRVGTEFVSALMAGSLIGYWLDRLFNTAPFIIIIMIIVSFVACIRNIYKLEMGLYKEDEWLIKNKKKE